MSRLHATEIRALPEHLGQIPGLYSQLPTIVEADRSDQGEPNDQGKADRKPGSAAPLNLTVVHLTDTRIKTGWRYHDPGHVATIDRFGTLPALVWWVDTITAAMTQAHVPYPIRTNPATVATECAWLLEVQQFVLAQKWAAMFVRDIARLQSKLEASSTGKVEFVPRCDRCALNDGRVVRLDPQDDASWYKCPRCNKEFTPSRSGDLARRQPPLPGAEIAAALGISEATIRTWKNRGYIAPATHDRGRPLYHLADVQRVNERVRERGTNRKGY